MTQILIELSCCWKPLFVLHFPCLLRYMSFEFAFELWYVFMVDLIHYLYGLLTCGILYHVRNSHLTSLAAILSAGLLPITFEMVRVTSVTPPTMSSTYHSDPLPTPLELVETTGLPTSPEPTQGITAGNVNLTVSVDVSGILLEGLRDPRTRTMVVNLEQIYTLTVTSAAQLEKLKVDVVKKAIQVLCWECFQIGILKRNFKMWLQTSPYNTPGFPHGRFSAADYDMTWQEVLGIHQIPHDHKQIHLCAHHSESTRD